MIVYLAMMYNFRPRKEWPEFYGIGLEAINHFLLQENFVNDLNGNARQPRALVAPILTFNINNKLVFDVEFDQTTGLPVDNDKPQDYEDDCLARRDSRLSLMSKHLLGLSEEDLEHTDFNQVAY